jgi:hypothetical protein
MKKLIYSILLINFMFLLAGCSSSRIYSNVTRFHSLSIVAQPKSFEIIPLDSQKGSIEFSVYSSQVASNLTVYGWHQDDKSTSAPDFFVVFSYGIDNGQSVSGTTPIIGQTGGGTSYSYGNVYNGYGSASYSGTTTTTPTFGVVGAQSYSTIVYTRFLYLDILDAKVSTTNNPVKVFEGRVKSCGSKSDYSEVLPTMIKALFMQFPGISGKTVTIKLRG